MDDPRSSEEDGAATRARAPIARSLAAFAAGVAAAVALAGARDVANREAFGSDTVAAVGALVAAAIGAVALSGALLRSVPVREALALRRPRLGTARLALVVAGVFGVSTLARLAVELLGGTGGSGLEQLESEIETAIDGARAPSVAWIAVGVAIGPGVAEELLFRGLLLGALLPRIGAARAALLSTVAFAAAHIDPLHALAVVPLGLYLAAVRLATGSTIAAIACHVANNALALALAAASPEARAAGVAASVVALPAACRVLAGLGRTRRERAGPA